MGLWEMIVAVVALGLGAQLIQSYLKSKENGAFGDEEREDLLKRIDSLEERIKVLERIATDNSKNIKDEIDRL